MDQKNRTRIAVLVAVIIVTAVFGTFSYSLFSTQTPPVVLPTLQPDSGSPPSPVPDSDPSARVEVTTQTVQAIIASLDRTSSYYRQMSIETFWTGGSGTTTVHTWVDGGCTYVRAVQSGGQIRYTLTADDPNVEIPKRHHGYVLYFNVW